MSALYNSVFNIAVFIKNIIDAHVHAMASSFMPVTMIWRANVMNSLLRSVFKTGSIHSPHTFVILKNTQLHSVLWATWGPIGANEPGLM